jgi:hypothetical protein
MNSKIFNMLHAAFTNIQLIKREEWIELRYGYSLSPSEYLRFNSLKYRYRLYHSLVAVAMADVILLREGRQPPGKIYSFIKSELRRYSS